MNYKDEEFWNMIGALLSYLVVMTLGVGLLVLFIWFLLAVI